MKEEEEEILEGWKHFLKAYVSYAQPSTLDFPLSEILQESIKSFNYIKSLNYVDPNA
jgi:hypothetical protein